MNKQYIIKMEVFVAAESIEEAVKKAISLVSDPNSREDIYAQIINLANGTYTERTLKEEPKAPDVEEKTY